MPLRRRHEDILTDLLKDARDYLREVTTNRQYRLFACACARMQGKRLPTCAGNTVETAERFADGEATAQELKAVLPNDTLCEMFAPYCVAYWDAWFAAWHAAVGLPGSVPVKAAAKCKIARCVFGIPQGRDYGYISASRFVPAPLVGSLARAAYEERILPSGRLDPIRVMVLADAIEESADAPDIITHLRDDGAHYRGCWAVDACLGVRGRAAARSL